MATLSALEEGSVSNKADQSLYYRVASPSKPENPSVLIVHGYGEHSGRYDHVIKRLLDAGMGVLAFDSRGHGQSEGRRGHVKRYDEYFDDVDAAMEVLVQRAPDSPIFLLGHSQGGLIALLYLAERGGNTVGTIISGPMLGFAVHIPGWKAFLGNAMSWLFPGLTMANTIDTSKLCHDPKVVKAYETDPLVHHVATARWFTEAKRAQQRAFAAAAEIRLPVLLLQAELDETVSAPAAKDFFEQLGASDKELKLYPELYHEVLNEPERDEILDEVIAWILRRGDAGSSD